MRRDGPNSTGFILSSIRQPTDCGHLLGQGDTLWGDDLQMDFDADGLGKRADLCPITAAERFVRTERGM
jgi:hypothetical protein